MISTAFFVCNLKDIFDADMALNLSIDMVSCPMKFIEVFIKNSIAFRMKLKRCTLDTICDTFTGYKELFITIKR